MAHMSKNTVIILVIVGLVLCGIVGAVIAGIALFLPVREEVSVVTTPDTVSLPDEPAGEREAPMTIEDESALVAEAIEEQALAHVTGIEVMTRLRRPVIVVSSDIGPEQAGLADEASSALVETASAVTTPEGATCTFYIELRSSEGDVMNAASIVDDRWKLATPPAPGDASGLRDWLEQVYGSGSPAPEPWMGRVVSVSADPAGTDGFVVVRTDLDQGVSADLAAAQTIIDAVDSSGVTFTSGVRVLFADGVWEWSSMLTGVDPFTGAAVP